MSSTAFHVLQCSIHCTACAVQAPGASRDVLLLDIALDNYLRLLIERTEKSTLSGDDLCEMTALVMRNALVTFDSEDFSQVLLFPLALRLCICEHVCACGSALSFVAFHWQRRSLVMLLAASDHPCNKTQLGPCLHRLWNNCFNTLKFCLRDIENDSRHC